VLRQHQVKSYTVHTLRLSEMNQVVRLIADVAQCRQCAGGDDTSDRKKPAGREGRAHPGSGELDQPEKSLSEADWLYPTGWFRTNRVPGMRSLTTH
jgi:hypothetical protein